MDHFLKFLVVGTTGFIINTVLLLLGVKVGLKPSIAGPLGAEFAVISNFILNNFWTFSDKKITDYSVLPGKFIQFNILSFGSVVIQFSFLKIGERIFGLKKFKEPAIEADTFKPLRFFKKLPLVSKVSWYFIFYVAGVGIGLIVNYLIYSLIIWK